MVVDEKARGDRAVPATAQRSRLNSVSLPPKTWQLIDEMRGSSSRGVFISVCVYRQISARLTTTDVWQASQASHQQSLPPNTL
jgi:hypothetical protein